MMTKRLGMNHGCNIRSQNNLYIISHQRLSGCHTDKCGNHKLFKRVLADRSAPLCQSALPDLEKAYSDRGKRTKQTLGRDCNDAGGNGCMGYYSLCSEYCIIFINFVERYLPDKCISFFKSLR